MLDIENLEQRARTMNAAEIEQAIAGIRAERRRMASERLTPIISDMVKAGMFDAEQTGFYIDKFWADPSLLATMQNTLRDIQATQRMHAQYGIEPL